MHRTRLLLFLGAVGLTGCGFSPAPQFSLNTEGRDPSSLSAPQREAVAEALANLFGTPDEPRIPAEAGLDLDLLRKAAGPICSDEHGTRCGLYRQHCVGCHGVSGDGAGPSAAVLSPYPRDFRNGLFKYTSTAAGARPAGTDLKRTLLRGLAGTAMPSFAQLRQDELDALLQYVQYLAIRGQVELLVIQSVVDDEQDLPLDMVTIHQDTVTPIVQMWSAAERFLVTPPLKPPLDTTASVAAGRKLFTSPTCRCVTCHGPDGRGDGQQTELFDDWNKPKLGATLQQTAALAKCFHLPIQRLRARNFYEGIFRGGDRDVDLYWRICVGIKGTPMPAAGPAPGAPGPLKPLDIRRLVHYVRSLSSKPGSL